MLGGGRLMQNIVINKQRLTIFLSMYLPFFMIGMAYTIYSGEISAVLLAVLFGVVSLYFFGAKRLVIFEPFTLFSMYFYTVIISCIYLYYTQFEDSIYISNQEFSINLTSLFNITVLYIIISYIFAYLGYKTFKKNFRPSIDLYNDGISLTSINIVVPVFAFISILNFYYNILVFAQGNPFIYMSNVSIRHIEFNVIGGTTIGYLFGYIAGYLWLYKILKKNKRFNFMFIMFILLTIFMKLSTGRILGTLVYILSYVAIFYMVKLKTDHDNNKKYVLFFVFMVFAGLGFYFYRVTSNLDYIGLLGGDFLSVFLNMFDVNYIGTYIIGKGNIPNVAVLMKVIEGWGQDIPFLYGESLFTWIYSVFPYSIRPEGHFSSVLLKNVWYSDTPGGNLPPTGMGEMFANFWYFGSVLGMYIFGAFAAFIYNLLNKFNNFWYLVMYVNISLGFIMLYPKGEFNNLSLWHIIPIGFTYLLLLLITTITRKKMMF